MLFLLVRYVLTAAFRDKVFISFLAIVALGVSLSIFMGSAAVIEREEFTAVFAAGGLRIAAVLGLVLFIVFYIRKSFDHKDIDFLLSRPVGRVTYIFGHSLALSILSIFIGGIIFIATSLIASFAGEFSMGHVLWSFSVLSELIIIANAALFFSMVLPSATMAALAVFALYVLSRMMGQLLGALAYGHGEKLEPIFNVISIFVPRLDLMGQTSWLIYGAEGQVGFGFIAVQLIVFSALFTLASITDLLRRQF